MGISDTTYAKKQFPERQSYRQSANGGCFVTFVPEWIQFVHEFLFVVTAVAVLVGGLFYIVTQASARVGGRVEAFVDRYRSADDTPASKPTSNDVTIDPTKAD